MKRKKLILVISIVVVVIAALSFRLVVWGIPIPVLCSSYYTTVFFKHINIPDPQVFANFLEQDGWEVRSWSYDNLPQDKTLVRATKEPVVFFSKPKTLIILSSPYGNPEEVAEGQIVFSISKGTGNRVANKKLYNDFVSKMNENFNLNLGYDKYRYTRDCSS